MMRWVTSLTSMILDSSCESDSWTTAIERIRLIVSRRISPTSGDSVRRAWMRSSDAIVWRLFLTRWWISWIIADLIRSSCSLSRSAVTSRTTSRTASMLPGRLATRRNQAGRGSAGIGKAQRVQTYGPSWTVFSTQAPLSSAS